MRKHDDLFSALLVNLLETDKPLRAALIYRLSDPLPSEMAAFEAVWPTAPVERRRLLMSRLAETSEASIEVDFSTVSLFALQDADAEVRRQAIEALWENEQPSTMRKLIALAQSDPDARVRAAAAIALGQFVLLGELEDIEPMIAKEAEEALLQICHFQEEELEVRRRALESIALSSRQEVEPLIEEAARHADLKMQASALFAMGRNGDSRWIPHISDALRSPISELCFEATRAAGEIGLTTAVPHLIRFAHSHDREIKEMAIWSLGEIGGVEAQNALFALADEETDEDLIEAIEDASNMATLSLGNFGLLVLPSDDDEDLDIFDEEQDAME
ncbi:MAG: HEAT repeat domain-containing protein [Anaerolineae bacterium]|nr:HEAT repeat domain-containing protein [Anaerolineae bacterium]